MPLAAQNNSTCSRTASASQLRPIVRIDEAFGKPTNHRRNAGRSTGPRTAQGKSRSAQNARRHGFASTLIDTAPRSKRAELLARALAGPDPDPDPDRLHQARIVAEMRVRLAQIAEAKIGLIERMNIELPPTKINFIYGLLSTRDWTSPLRVADVVAKCLRQLRCLDGYEQRARSRCRRAMQLMNISMN